MDEWGGSLASMKHTDHPLVMSGWCSGFLLPLVARGRAYPANV
jgi:hypothetical protein